MFLLQTFFCEKSSFNLCIEKCKNIKILSKCEFQRAELYNLRLISKSFLLSYIKAVIFRDLRFTNLPRTVINKICKNVYTTKIIAR